MNFLSTIIQNNAKNALLSTEVMQHLAEAHRYLGELKGLAFSIPNQAILINTLGLQEAQDSSEIENIVTTQDELYKQLLNNDHHNVAAKEVANYKEALHFLYEKQQDQHFISTNMLIDAQKIIKGNDTGIRKQSGTQLFNHQTKETVYIPPAPNELQELLNDLEKFINDDQTFTEIDPLIKMALIHHQFESIHPFYDGNGRIGRILNIIYLIQANLLNTPILYLSRYINHNKQQYYQLLQSVREQNNWQDWLIYILHGVAKTAKNTIRLVAKIKELQQAYKEEIRTNHSNIYSQELLNNIFKHPYTKIAFLQDELKISRLTASRYLDKLTQATLLKKHKLGRENYYFNHQLVELLRNTDTLHNK